MVDGIHINTIKFMSYALKSSTSGNTGMTYKSIDCEFFIVNLGWRESGRLLCDKSRDGPPVDICHIILPGN